MASPDRESTDTAKVNFDRDEVHLKVSHAGATLEITGPGGFGVRTAHEWLLARGSTGMRPKEVLVKRDLPARDEDEPEPTNLGRPAFHGTMGEPPPAFFGVGPSRDSGKNFSFHGRMLSPLESTLNKLWEGFSDKHANLEYLERALTTFLSRPGVVRIVRDGPEYGRHEIRLEIPRAAFPRKYLPEKSIHGQKTHLYRVAANGDLDVPRAFLKLMEYLAIDVFDAARKLERDRVR